MPSGNASVLGSAQAAHSSVVLGLGRDGRAAKVQDTQVPGFSFGNGQRTVRRQCGTGISVPVVKGEGVRNDAAAGVAWLWRGSNLTAVAAGCACALVLQTSGCLVSPGTAPAAVGGAAMEIIPPLVGLVLCAFLGVLSQRGEGRGKFAQRTVASSLLLATVSCSLMWTAIDWVLCAYGVTPVLGGALPFETLLAAAALLLFVTVERGRELAASGGKRGKRNVLIAGTDAVALGVRDHLQSPRSSAYEFRGFLRTSLPGNVGFENDADVAGHVDELVHVSRAMFVDEVILSTRPSMDVLEGICEQARSHHIDLRYVPSTVEALRRPAEVEYIGSLPTIVVHRKEHKHAPLLAKRALDIVLGSVALLVSTPVMLVIAAAIKLGSAGPLIYASERIGVKGKGFRCYKFRTMVQDADALRPALAHLNERKDILFKITKDPRVTPIGRVLRKYSLDELPQLFNVMRGEMSLVGPRPSLRSEVAQYKTPHYRRLDVIPGMTGLWQVEARSDPSFESYVKLDCHYADTWSIGLDVRILLRTLSTVILGTGV